MKILNLVISFFSPVLFLKKYNFSEEKLRILKKRFPYLIAIWGLLILPFIFAFPVIFGEVSENIRLQVSFVLFLVFALYHWFMLIYISKFAKNHNAYFALFIPMALFLMWNLALLNSPTYYGAMDGFATLMTAQLEMLIIVILPTFLFTLQMVKIKNKPKGLLLLLIVFISAIFGIKNCMGKEGYLSDSTGKIFTFLIILLLAVVVYLVNISNKRNLNKHEL